MLLIFRKAAPAIVIVAALLAGPLSVHAGDKALNPPMSAHEFDEMYDDVAAYVMNPDHSPDLARGLVEIEYGDAKAYFPVWVYALEEQPGFSATPFQLEIAGQMVQRYSESLDKLVSDPWHNLMDFDLLMNVAIGIEGVLRTYEHKPGAGTRDITRTYLDFAKPATKASWLLEGYHVEPYGPTTVMAGGAWFYLYYAQIMGPGDPHYNEYKQVGLSLLKKADKRLYKKKQGKYIYSNRPGYDFTYVYPNTVMVQALLRAYAVTGDQRYYDQAMTVMETITRELYHPGYKGFLAAEDNCRYHRKYQKIGPQYNQEYMALSAHNYITYAYFALYEAGGFKDPSLLEPAVICLRFERDRLWDHKGKIQHHINRGVLSGPRDYCMGCNIQTLFHIVQYKALLQKRPVMGLAGATKN